MMLPGLPGNPLPITFDQQVATAVADMPVRSIGKKLSGSERGLILPSPIEVLGYAEIGVDRPILRNMFSPRPDALDLRQAVLFWDVVHLPEEIHPLYESSPDIQFLEQSGILRRYEGPTQEAIAARFGGNFGFVGAQGMRPIYERLRLNLFADLERSEPGKWAMGRGIQSPEIPTGERTAGRGALVKLTNMLPIPDGEVNLEDVLAFKEKRRDELVSLRSYVSELFSKVSAGDVDEMVRGNHLLEFEKAVWAYQSVLSESRMKAVLSDLAGSFNVAGPIATILTTLTDPTGLIPISLLAITGAITISPFNGLSSRKTNEAFEYVGQYHREVSWQKSD